LPASHGKRRHQKGVTVAIGSDSLADDHTGIVDRLCDGKDFEVALGKIAKRVEIKHLVVDI
jgi:hypothetical protein